MLHEQAECRRLAATVDLSRPERAAEPASSSCTACGMFGTGREILVDRLQAEEDLSAAECEA